MKSEGETILKQESTWSPKKEDQPEVGDRPEVRREDTEDGESTCEVRDCEPCQKKPQDAEIPYRTLGQKIRMCEGTMCSVGRSVVMTD